MNDYIREIRAVLKRLGLTRRSDSAWIGGFAVGAGVGLISGATMAALLTPANGKEMRKLVGSKAKKIARTAEQEIADDLKMLRANGKRLHLPL
jgi:hypothetical protein